MKYLKLFESINEVGIEKICKKYGIENWSINKDSLVDVDGDVKLNFKGLNKLPLRFGKITGDFLCYNNKLTTLEGGPKEVGRHYKCINNKLTTLEGSPTKVGGDFDCQYNQLITLEGSPKEVGGDFNCSNNKLITLKWAPEYVGSDFSCYNNNLTTLEGGPEEVSGNFHCDTNNLTTLEGGPTEVGGSFLCFDNYLNTLKWTPEYIDGKVSFLPNDNLPTEFLNFLKLNEYSSDIQKYILKWQKDYAIWRRDGSFNEVNFIQMMEAAQDELENIKFTE